MDMGPETANVFVTQQIKRMKIICFVLSSLGIYLFYQKLASGD